MQHLQIMCCRVTESAVPVSPLGFQACPAPSMESLIAELCGTDPSDPLPVWVSGNVGICFNQLILSAVPHALLAVISACHAGAHRSRSSCPAGWAWTCRLVTSFFLGISALGELVLGAVFPRLLPSAVEVLSGAVSCLAWVTHFLALLSLRRKWHGSSRGPLSFLVPVPLQVPSLVISVVWLCHGGAVSAPLNLVLVSRLTLSYLRLAFILAYLVAFLAPPTLPQAPNVVSINDDGDDRSPLLSFSDYGWAPAEDGESWWSRFFYLWMNPLMQTGAKGDLKSFKDVYPLPRHLCTANVRQELQYFPRTKRLSSSLNASFGARYYSLGLLKLGAISLGFMGPLLLNLLVDFMETGEEPLSWGVLYTMGLFTSGVLGALLQNQFTHEVNKVMLAVRAAVLTSVYRKAIRGEGTSLGTFSPGEVVNFMSTDTDRISNFCRSFHELWSLPLQFAVTLYLLYRQVGVAFLGGLGLALLLVPVNKVVASRIMANNQDMLQHKDARVKLMAELLTGMRVVKFYTWESHFASRVGALREKELRSLRAIKLLDAVCVYLWAALPVLISIITFITYVLLGHQLTAAKVFTALALVGMLILPLNNFPWVLNGVLEAKVSLDRIQRFLELPEQNLLTYYRQVPSSDPSSVVEFSDALFSWGDAQGSEQCGALQLCVQHLCIQKGSLVAVVGKVGSGKSSLLAAITGELSRMRGDLLVAPEEPGFGYTAQEPWIQFATIRENILFGKEMNAALYQEVLEACALADDLSILPAGDQTEVGENGVMLSGGQKARVALARAVYQEKDIYLLDDPLAAVDADVASHLMEKCIMGILRHRTRILCSHRTELLDGADLVVLMEEGKILCSGPPDKVLPLVENSTKLRVCQHRAQDEVMNGQDAERESDKEDQAHSHVLGEEEKKEGAVALQVYGAYWRSVGSYLASSVLLALLFMQASRNMSDWWLSHWISSLPNTTRNSSLEAPSPTLLLFSSTGLLSPVTVMKNERQNISADINFYLSVYGGIAVANSVCTALRAALFALGTVQAATVIHRHLLKRVLKATVTFFDITPIGRIINRFSSDLYCVDDSLPFILNIFLANMFGLLGMLLVISYGLPWILLALLPLAVLYYHIQRFYRYTSRELKRLHSITLSPIYNQFSETLSGLCTIRAMRHSDRFQEECEKRLERNQRCLFASNSAIQWLDIRLQMIGVMVVTAIAVIAIVQHQLKAGNPGLVGLALSYALSITGLLSGLISSFTQTEAMMVSVERAEEYSRTLPSEPVGASVEVAPDWPSRGHIEFQEVVLCYRQDLPNALDGVSFTICPGEKIGIVGRTGSGKSSLFLALFRMMELSAGFILIDNLSARQVSLDALRSRLAVIPQDAFLFSGSVRENLDPLSRHPESDLHEVLEQCHLGALVARIGGLEAEVGDRGKNFSLGQRQLLCLARALLTQAKILCIDEATASVDHQTDCLLQQTIRERFKERTVLTIAHRLNTIMDSDRVLVMHAGKVAELDSPAALSQRTDSHFYRLIHSGQV
uniref:Multidrug resistance-associated protein 7 n=1 Tax=Leptobrachium leishanense TaxID=445787 RepID=A0A8C5RAM8_9ANUR